MLPLDPAIHSSPPPLALTIGARIVNPEDRYRLAWTAQQHATRGERDKQAARDHMAHGRRGHS